MIPKIIHYIWLGNSPMPDEMQTCINSWRKWMPDYVIKRWDDTCIDKIDSVFVREAIAEKKWAFASDVIRLYAIKTYGGIYLDTDVMVYRSFDTLLNNHAFIGREGSIHLQGIRLVNYLTTCCFGAEKDNEFISTCYNYYKDRHFITSFDRSLPQDLRYDIRLNSEIFCILAQQVGYDAGLLANHRQTCEDNVLTIFPSWSFDATKVQPDTYSRHLALGTWRNRPKKTYHYSLQYKIEWRVVALLKKILRKMNYEVLKID